LIETFGWPGATIILGYGFVVQYATAEQKQRLIEMYLLGGGIRQVWPMVVLSVVFAVLSIAQHRWYVKQIGIYTNEIARIGEEKSALQERRAGRRLQHGDRNQEED
jgi:hypothetical protein